MAGRLMSGWLLVGSKEYVLAKPAVNEPVPDSEFREFKDKTVILFGGKYKDLILFTEIYEK